MTIVSVERRPNRSGSFGEGYTRKKKAVWRVLADSDSVDVDEAAAACGVSIGDAYTSWDGSSIDTLCTLKDFSVEQSEEGSLIWIATGSYETPADAPQTSQSQQQGQSQGGDQNNPTQWLPKVTRSYGEIQIVQRLAYDRAGDNTLTLTVVNSAGYPFSNVPARKVQFPIYTHTRYETAYDQEFHRNYAGALNDQEWNGFAAGMWLLASWEVDDEYIGGTLYYLHRRTFYLCPDDLWPPDSDNPTWQQWILQQGTRNALGEPILDPLTGQEVSRDVVMADDGFELTPAEIAAGEFVYGEFRDHKELPFDVFGITF